MNGGGDRFLPDFVAALTDGTSLAVEYKGEHLRSADEAKEKDMVGKLWAAKSSGTCLFAMVGKGDMEGSRLSSLQSTSTPQGDRPPVFPKWLTVFTWGFSRSLLDHHKRDLVCIFRALPTLSSYWFRLILLAFSHAITSVRLIRSGVKRGQFQTDPLPFYDTIA